MYLSQGQISILLMLLWDERDRIQRAGTGASHATVGEIDMLMNNLRKGLP